MDESGLIQESDTLFLGKEHRAALHGKLSGHCAKASLNVVAN
jgi:hypothetical protein